MLSYNVGKPHVGLLSNWLLWLVRWTLVWWRQDTGDGMAYWEGFSDIVTVHHWWHSTASVGECFEALLHQFQRRCSVNRSWHTAVCLSKFWTSPSVLSAGATWRFCIRISFGSFTTAKLFYMHIKQHEIITFLFFWEKTVGWVKAGGLEGNKFTSYRTGVANTHKPRKWAHRGSHL